ncbi:hypothetical protein QAD02_021930 [Eretmocerus hayati]|uniref:Uncharacterized protein n=1 Tax=Eretmocerus hayati TaxID=131215 RepID=A0ACC2PRK2_9HYME|nr:hypothetical protein QAD02_021930 [Eretmocerus hayati]
MPPRRRRGAGALGRQSRFQPYRASLHPDEAALADAMPDIRHTPPPAQDITEIADHLPRVPSSLDVVVVRRGSVPEYRDSNRRREKVTTALRFLKSNNPYFADIHMNEDHLSQSTLDGNISDQIREVQVPEIVGEDGGVEENDEIYERVIPNDIRIQEIERIQDDVDDVV